MTGSDAGTNARLSAGTINVTGGTAPLTLIPGADAQYQMVSQMGAIWSPGNTLTISAGGDVVPAFTGSVEYPTPLIVMSPMRGPTTSTIDHASDFTATWVPGTGDVRILFLEGTSDDPGIAQYAALTQQVRVDCTFPSAPGTATIPASTMMALPPATTTAPNAVYVIDRSNRTTVTAGNYQINLIATVGGTSAYARIQ